MLLTPVKDVENKPQSLLKEQREHKWELILVLE